MSPDFPSVQGLPINPRDFFLPHGYSNITGEADRYRDYVSRLAGQWPGLAYLDLYLYDKRYLDRRSFPLTLLKFSRKNLEQKPQMKHNFNLESLLRWVDDDYDKLIILEDPTPNMIAELGGKFRIDPQFWADFLVGPSWFGSGKLYVGAGKPEIPYRDDSLLEQLWPLPSAAKKQQHMCCRFVAQVEANMKDCNVKSQNLPAVGKLAGIYPLGNGAKAGPPNGAKSIPLRRIFAIWQNIWQNEKGAEETPWIGIVAMQHQSSRLPLFNHETSYIYRNFLKRLSSQQKIDMDLLRITGKWEGRLQHKPKFAYSMKHIYCFALEQSLEDKNFMKKARGLPNLLFLDLLRLVGCFWVSEIESRHLLLLWMDTFYLHEVGNRRTNFSWLDPLTLNPTSQLTDKLQSDIIYLHGLRIDIGPYQHLLKETELLCGNMRENNNNNVYFRELKADFVHLQGEVVRLEDRIVKTIGFLHSISEDFEQERSSYCNRLVLILTIWAFLYSPISLTSSIMNLGHTKSSNSSKVGDINIFWKVVVVLGGTVTLVVLVLLWVTELLEWYARKKSSLRLRIQEESH